MTVEAERKRADDLSPEHLTWLVEKRSENQKSSLKLHLIIRSHRKKIDEDHSLTDAAQGLIAIVFSLWRAVFLSDLSESDDSFMDDAANFLGNLVMHNAVAYPQDRNTREWTFVYYVNNARYRLKAFVDDNDPDILSKTDYDDHHYGSDKERWSNAQTAVDRAIENFGKILMA